MFFPGQIKLFADGAIISQLMQMKDGYTDGHHGEWIMPPDELGSARQALLGRRLPHPHPRQRRPRPRRRCSTSLERRMRENPRPDHRTRHRALRQFDGGSGGAHRAARRDRQRQSLLPGRLRRQVRRVRPRPGARRRDGARQLGGRARHPALLSLRPADGAERPALPRLVRASTASRRRAASPAPSSASRVDQALRAITIEAAYSWRKETGSAASRPARSPTSPCSKRTRTPSRPKTLKDISDLGHGLRGKGVPDR